MTRFYVSKKMFGLQESLLRIKMIKLIGLIIIIILPCLTDRSAMVL